MRNSAFVNEFLVDIDNKFETSVGTENAGQVFIADVIMTRAIETSW